MTECSICGRGGAMTLGPVRYCQGHCVCVACWDTIACMVLALVPSGEQPLRGAHRREATREERSAVVCELLDRVAGRVRREG